MKYSFNNSLCSALKFSSLILAILICLTYLWAIHASASATLTEPINGGIDDSRLHGHSGYRKWKTVFLGTRAGRNLWDTYNGDRSVRLQILIAPNSGGDQGAATENIIFNRAGKLIGATIVLGPNFGKNAPSRAPYPVTSYLGDSVTREVRAAAILAHEFGHVEHARRIGAFYQRQNELLDQNEAGYIKYQRNWFKTPEYQSIVSELGDTPVDIMRRREYAAEGPAILVIKELLGTKMPSSLRRAIQDYYETHPYRNSQ